MTINTSGIGQRQVDTLGYLIRYNGWNAFSAVLTNWPWENNYKTAQLLKSLVKRGVAEQVGVKKINGFFVYKATDEGIDFWKRRTNK